MKTPTLAIGTAVIGMAIGFLAGKSAEKQGEKQDAEAVSKRAAPPRSTSASREASGRRPAGAADGVLAGLLGGRQIAELSAADAYQLIKPSLEIDWGGDPLEWARRNYELQLMLSKLPLRVMEEVMNLAVESGNNFRSQRILTAYALRDGQKAMDWASRQPDAAGYKAAVISAMASRDPAGAADLLQQGFMDGSYTSSWMATYNLAAVYAKQGGTALLQFIDTMPSSSVSNLLSNSLRNLPKDELPAFMDVITQRMKDGKLQGFSMSNLLQNLATADPTLARSLIEKMEPGKERAERELAFAGTLSQQGKTGEALELLKSAMAQQPGKEKEFVLEQTSNLMYNNVEFALQLANQLPAGAEFTKEDVLKLSNRGAQTDLVSLAKFLKSPEEQAAYLEEAIASKMTNDSSRLNEMDYRILGHRIESLNLSASGKAGVAKALATSRDKALGGN